MKKILLLFISVMIFVLSCSENTNVSVNMPPVITPEMSEFLDSIFCKSNPLITDYPSRYNDNMIVINSEEELQKLHNSKISSHIDFSKYTLIAGKIVTHSAEDKLLEKSYSINKPLKKCIYKFTIERSVNVLNKKGFVYGWEIIPKLESPYHCSLQANVISPKGVLWGTWFEVGGNNTVRFGYDSVIINPSTKQKFIANYKSMLENNKYYICIDRNKSYQDKYLSSNEIETKHAINWISDDTLVIKNFLAINSSKPYSKNYKDIILYRKQS